MNLVEVKVPDIGDFDNVEIVDVICKKGDEILEEDPLISVESDKATMDIPSPVSGVVHNLLVKIGDRVSKGDLILKMGNTESSKKELKPIKSKEGKSNEKSTKTGFISSHSKDNSLKTDISCEVLVLGSGPGGYTAAFRGADFMQVVRQKY